MSADENGITAHGSMNAEHHQVRRHLEQPRVGLVGNDVFLAARA